MRAFSSEAVIPQTDPAAIADSIGRYLQGTKLKLGNLGADGLSVRLPNDISTTVVRDFLNTRGQIGIVEGDNSTTLSTALGIGMVIGAALERSGVGVPQPYEDLVDGLSEGVIE